MRMVSMTLKQLLLAKHRIQQAVRTTSRAQKAALAPTVPRRTIPVPPK
jgi:hypothetical protein